MSGYRLTAPHGRAIERQRPVGFSFNGRALEGFAGDTLASALLANGVRLVGRSFKLHRPRGILSCGVEEPIGLLDIGDGDRRVPNTRATDILLREGLQARSGNCWPSVGLDLAAVNAAFASWMPAGFYYKTFMWPHWHWFEPTIRRMAGLGRAGDGVDPDRYDEVSLAVELLVVGAGLAGLQAAAAAAKAGLDVLLVENDAMVGGWAAAQPTHRALIDSLHQAFRAAGGRLLLHTAAVALYDHRLAVAIEAGEGPVRERLLKIRAGRIVLATGTYERPMLFPDNDRPGVMLAGAVERYAALYGVACGHRVVIATACDASYAVAHALKAAGIDVVAIVDRRPDGGSAAAASDVPLHRAHAVVGICGSRSVRGVQIAPLAGGAVETLDADTLAMSGGFTPNVNLYSQAGGSLKWLDDAAMFVPARPLKGISVVGAAAGVFEVVAALDHASAAGTGSDGLCAMSACGGGTVPGDNAPPAAALDSLGRRPGKQFVDFQNDVSRDDVALAARENYRSVEHFKRYTTTGMATDQGKTSNVNALVQLGLETGRAPNAVGTTKFRPPFKPVTLSTLAGGRQGERYRPLKRLPAHGFHAAHGALFEEFGGWLRPAAYPRGAETLDAAAEREAGQTRRSVGLFEGSPLGKLEVFGPDAAAFLDLMYVGTMSTLAVGQARYGALLDENGIVVDDGIVARLAPDRFWVNTTSGGAERVALGFEEWLHCEFVDLRVAVVLVTSQWGNVTIAGPRAWLLLESVGFDPALAPIAMKHMTMRESRYAGVGLRVLRASFSGELGYEINLPALHTAPLLERLWEAGGAFDAGLYGIEALQIMRIEKGFVHVGADTDGTTLPGDVGLARSIDKKAANFVGRRSLLRPVARDAGRMQLVGLKPLDRRTRLPVGAHIAASPPPAPLDGFVTSSCYSPTLGEPVALAMLRRGGQRHGEKLRLYHLGATIDAEVTKTPFFDPAGERLHG